jgi:hypothetical protein
VNLWDYLHATPFGAFALAVALPWSVGAAVAGIVRAVRERHERRTP